MHAVDRLYDTWLRIGRLESTENMMCFSFRWRRVPVRTDRKAVDYSFFQQETNKTRSTTIELHVTDVFDLLSTG
jgi:hypothetical protein